MYQHTKLTLVAALAILCAGCAALPTDDDYTGVNNNAVAAAEGQRVRECRWAGATGTKMRTRICHSQEEWAAIDAATAAPQDNDEFFRRQRENSTLTGNVDVPDATGF
jgi:hypothetical protein